MEDLRKETPGVINRAMPKCQKLMEQWYVFVSALNAWAHFAFSKSLTVRKSGGHVAWRFEVGARKRLMLKDV